MCVRVCICVSTMNIGSFFCDLLYSCVLFSDLQLAVRSFLSISRFSIPLLLSTSSSLWWFNRAITASYQALH